jgi:hypothetical protein
VGQPGSAAEFLALSTDFTSTGAHGGESCLAVPAGSGSGFARSPQAAVHGSRGSVARSVIHKVAAPVGSAGGSAGNVEAFAGAYCRNFRRLPPRGVIARFGSAHIYLEDNDYMKRQRTGMVYA